MNRRDHYSRRVRYSRKAIAAALDDVDHGWYSMVWDHDSGLSVTRGQHGKYLVTTDTEGGFEEFEGQKEAVKRFCGLVSGGVDGVSKAAKVTAAPDDWTDVILEGL